MGVPNFVPTAEFKRRFEVGRKTRAITAARELCCALRAMNRDEAETQILMKVTQWIVREDSKR